MTAHNRQHTTRNTRAALLVASVITGALLLTGCTPSPAATTRPSPTKTTTPTPTPTATKAAAPASEDEAVKAATVAIDHFLEVRGKVNAAGGKDPAPLSGVATGPALTIVTADAKRLADAGSKSTGVIVYSVQTAYASDLVQGGVTIPFGTVNTSGCQDGSNYKVFDKSGNPVQQPEGNSIINMTVVYSPQDENWLVQNVTASGVKC